MSVRVRDHRESSRTLARTRGRDDDEGRGFTHYTDYTLEPRLRV